MDQIFWKLPEKSSSLKFYLVLNVVLVHSFTIKQYMYLVPSSSEPLELPYK